MKTDIELCDEFIESLIVGDIESHILDAVAKNTIEIKNFEDGLREFRNEIMRFRYQDDPALKAKAAKDAVESILLMRFNGILKNNPNTVKSVAEHRDYYRNRALAAEERVKDLERRLVDAYTAFDRMQQRFESMGQKPARGQGDSEG